MNPFIYLINIGIVFLIFEYFFEFIGFLMTLLMRSILIHRPIIYILAGIKYYIIVLLFSAITLGAINESYYGDNSWIVFSIIGGVVMYLTISGTMYENYKSAIESNNYALAKMFQNDIFFLIGSILLYIIMVFNPSMVDNFVSIGFFQIVEFVYSFTILRIALNICGALFMISMLYQGIVSAFAIGLMIIGAIVSLVRK